MTPRTRKNILIGLLFVLTLSAVVLGVSWMSAYQTKPVTVPTVPQPVEPTPPPDVGACSEKIQSMQTAASLAKIGVAFLVSGDSKYAPAAKVAIAAVDAALANAKAQCATGGVDGWTVALAAFDAAMAKLASQGESLAASSVPNDIMPPPPYTVSLDRFTTLVLAEEMKGTVDEVDEP